MTRLALIALLVASPVIAEPIPCAGPGDGDLCELRDSALGHPAEFYYSNNSGMTSDGLEGMIFIHGDIEVQVWIEVDANQGAERIMVVSDEYFPVPAEADVRDGEFVVIQLIRDIM